MPKSMRLFAALCLICLAANASADELPKVERTLAKEPKYTHQPRYFLLVFGPAAKTLIWCVLDGDNVLYVDRNANGDLTDKGERFLLDEKDKQFHIGDITEHDGKTTHRELLVVAQANVKAPAPPAIFVTAKINGKYSALTNIELDKSTARPQDAPLRHFNGPLSVYFMNRDHAEFTHRRGQVNLTIHIGTHYSSRGDRVIDHSVDLHHESSALPRDIHPIAEISFPGKTADAKRVVIQLPLVHRC